MPAADAALVTSSPVMRPPGPVPAMPCSEIPSSTAVRFATGVAFGRSPGGDPPPDGDVGVEAASGASVSSGCLSLRAATSPFARSAIGSPTAAVAPSGTRIEASVPADSAS